jgi:tRNA threonylcarbamoyl adenosine modification protein YeaZ
VTLVLAIDTSTPAISAALCRLTDDGVDAIAERTIVDSRAHGELLGPQIRMVLGGIDLSQVGALVVGVGPGPFTGLRVGLVTAATMAQALGRPAYGVCSLDGIGARTSGLALVATDARRKEIYWAQYVDGVRIGEPAVGHPADVAKELAATTIAAGDGAVRYADVLGLPVHPPQYPSLPALVELAAPRILNLAPTETLTPLYLRRPDAVEPSTRKAVLP